MAFLSKTTHRREGQWFPESDHGTPAVRQILLSNGYLPILPRSIGVEEANIIYIPLDDDKSQALRDPLELGKCMRAMTADKSRRYFQ